MIRYKQLVTLKVIDKTTKQTIGKIKDIIYSDDYKKIDYLIIKNDNLIKNKTPISYTNVHFLNKNQALYLDNINTFEAQLERNIKEGFQFIDKEIRTENDECIGFVKDVVINKEDGTINGFIITEGIIEDLLKGRNYMPLLDSISIKEDCVCISNNDFF